VRVVHARKTQRVPGPCQAFPVTPRHLAAYNEPPHLCRGTNEDESGDALKPVDHPGRHFRSTEKEPKLALQPSQGTRQVLGSQSHPTATLKRAEGLLIACTPGFRISNRALDGPQPGTISDITTCVWWVLLRRIGQAQNRCLFRAQFRSRR
jgi:hypothetical protein